MIYNNEIETLPLSKLRKLQSEGFVHLVNYMYNNQSFYKSLWNEKGIDVSRIKSIEDIARFQFTHKNDLG